MSAYMLWLNSSRERIKSENPGISITEISKKAGEMWRQLGKDEKEVRRWNKENKRGYVLLVCPHNTRGIMCLKSVAETIEQYMLKLFVWSAQFGSAFFF